MIEKIIEDLNDYIDTLNQYIEEIETNSIDTRGLYSKVKYEAIRGEIISVRNEINVIIHREEKE